MNLSFMKDPKTFLFIGAVSVVVCTFLFSLRAKTDLGLGDYVFIQRQDPPPESRNMSFKLRQEFDPSVSGHRLRVQQQPHHQPHQQQVLLVSYGRSGSTFTSELIRFHKDVFYVFEPLGYLQPQRNWSQTVHLPDSAELMSRDVLESILTCQYSLDAVMALQSSFGARSKSTEKFHRCQQKSSEGQRHLACLYDLINDCKKHPVVFIKTIRFKIAWLQTMLASQPNLKILYLIRDPRATLYSQSRVFRLFSLTSEATRVSSQHCQMVSDDLQAFRNLQRDFPDRVKAVRYEDGATSPLTFARAIWAFLGFPVTKQLQVFVKSLTTPKAAKRRPSAKSSFIDKTSRTKTVFDLAKSKKGVSPTAGNSKIKGAMKVRRQYLGSGRINEIQIPSALQEGTNLAFKKTSEMKTQLRKSRLKRGLADYDTHRDDPRAAMDKWRLGIGLAALRKIDDQCGHLYQALGYTTVSSQRDLEDTRNATLTLQPEPGGIFDSG